MTFALTGARIFDGAAITAGRAVVIDGSEIVAVPAESDLPGAIERRQVEGLIAPGFIDIQVNGGGGVLFNRTRTVDGIAAIGAAHRRYGTTGFLPTFISDTPERMGEAAQAVRDGLRAGIPGLLGVHFEGPCLNPARKGIHDARYLRALSEKDLALLTSPGLGRVLVTLAPETADPPIVARLAGAGVIVSAGHSEADAATVAAARAAGLTGFTHLFNAMPALAGRAPGPVGAALTDHEAWCGLIVDLHHVSPVSLRAAIAARGWRRMILVSDAMPTVSAEVGEFDLFDRKITLHDGRLTSDDGTLAGAHLDMAAAVRNAVQSLDVPLSAALHMASRAPAEFLGLGGRLGRVAPGCRASLVLLDDKLRVVDTWIDGVC